METLSLVPVYDKSMKCWRCPAKNNEWFLLSDCDVWIWPFAQWKCDKNGHVRAEISLHRLVMNAASHQLVDHIDRDKFARTNASIGLFGEPETAAS